MPLSFFLLLVGLAVILGGVSLGLVGVLTIIFSITTVILCTKIKKLGERFKGHFLFSEILEIMAQE